MPREQRLPCGLVRSFHACAVQRSAGMMVSFLQLRSRAVHVFRLAPASMRNPFQVLCLSATPPDLVTSPFGPFVISTCRTLEEVATALHNGPCDALLVELKTPQEAERFLAWHGLAHAV